MLLDVKDNGFILKIPGLPHVRTPVKIYIEKMDINLVTLSLRKAGIRNYQITCGDDNIIKSDEKTKLDNDLTNKLVNKIDNLEIVIQKLFEEKSKYTQNLSLKNIKTEEETEVKYIPDVDIDKMLIKGEINPKQVHQRNNDIEESADLLNKIINKK